MFRSLSTPQQLHLPGTCVVLADNPTGPRMSVLAMDRKGTSISYLVVWHEASGERHEAQYAAEQLMLPGGARA